MVPSTLTICGSMRSAVEMLAFANDLRETYGIVVHVPTKRATPSDELLKLPDDVYQDVCRGRTWEHFRLIEMADAVFIFNALDPKTNLPYAGVSTTLEIAWAAAHAKPIYALREGDPEACRAGLYLGICPDPASLAKALGLRKP
jgi:hypothetical protein